MLIGIDDSGSFANEHTGLFAAVYIRPRKIIKIEKLFLEWENSLPEATKDNGEVKGRLLDEAQLADFATRVMSNNGIFQIKHHVFAIPIEGQSAENVAYQREKNVKQLQVAVEDYRKQGSAFYAIAESYSKMAAWLKKRSMKTILKMELLSNTIYGSINDSILFSVLKGFDRELGQLSISIDKAFVNKEENMPYWRDMLRMAIWDLTYNGKGIIHLKNWNSHHPFIKRFYKFPKSRSSLAVFTDDIRKCINFYDSREHFEIRIADIVANTYFRHYVMGEELSGY